MTSKLETQDQKKIWSILQNINNSWVNDNLEKLNKNFHKDMVIVSPNGRELGKGREICVQSYKDFTNQAVIKDFKQKDPRIDIYGTTAITSYSFEMTYEMNGITYQDIGRDMFVFILEGSNWLAVWRTILPQSQDK